MSTWNLASATEKLIFKSYLILFDLNTYMWLVITALDGQV